METTKYIWQNGEMVAWEDAKIHVLTHTLHYGGGVFEGVRVYNAEKGPAIFRLAEHTERLFYSAGCLKMTPEFDQKQIEYEQKNDIATDAFAVGVIIELAKELNYNNGDMPELVAALAGIKGASSHSGRRQFLTELADKGINVRVIMALARHKDISTTMEYIDFNESKLRSAIELV